MRALYVSHNGMLENLGQAQVLPYLRGLVRRGIDIDLLSFELPSALADPIATLRESLRSDGIRWTALQRARDPRLRTKMFESGRGVLHAFKMALSHPPDIVHGRSYLPTAIADLVATTVPKARLVFDCRGMLGDEYVDAGYWTTKRPEYRLIKRYERRLFQRSEGIVVLTETLRRIVLDRGWMGSHSTIAAIPCCVDLDRFRFDMRWREEARRELGLDDNRLIIVYSGSLGGWYQEAELARFVQLVKTANTTSRHGGGGGGGVGGGVTFLVLTHQNADGLCKLLGKENGSENGERLTPNEIVVRKVPPDQMAKFLCAGDLALSFIKSCFSKLGSSPTKVAEYLACGLPVVLNGDIGDQSDLAVETDACVVLPSLAHDELARAVPHALRLATTTPLENRVARCRKVAEQRFGLERVGVTRYEQLYRTIVAARR